MLARTSTVLGRKMENKKGPEPEGLVCLVGGGASRTFYHYLRARCRRLPARAMKLSRDRQN
jgi:hypothetical protein